MKLNRIELRRLIESVINEDIRQNRIDEAGVALIVSSILSIPAVMQGIAKLLKKIGKKYNKEFAAVDKLEHASHFVHDSFQAPIKGIIGGSYRLTHKGKKMDPDKLQKITNIIFAIIVACLACASFINSKRSFSEAIQHIKHSSHIDKAGLLHVGLGILETVLGGEEIVEEIHLLQAIVNPKHTDAFAHEIDSYVSNDHKGGKSEKSSGKDDHGGKSIHESLSRGSLYRKRYYGRY